MARAAAVEAAADLAEVPAAEASEEALAEAVLAVPLWVVAGIPDAATMAVAASAECSI